MKKDELREKIRDAAQPHDDIPESVELSPQQALYHLDTSSVDDRTLGELARGALKHYANDTEE